MRNTVELMVNLSNGPLLTQEFVPVHIQTDVLNNPEITISSPPLIKVEKEMLQKAFSKYLNTKNAVDKIAEELGISKSSVYRKLKKYGLSA
jgi:transcriptional regulator of acetoin/glycerol metabolism